MISITDFATKKIQEFGTQEKTPFDGLRIYLSSGGCSGFQYGMRFDKAQQGDIIDRQGDIILLIDPDSAKFLKDTVLDYTEELTGTGFVFKNPNVRSKCACGLSVEV